MCRRFVVSLLIATVALALASAQEPVKPKLTPSIATTTRQAALFTGLEKQLLRALQKKGKAAAQGMLADDFEIAMPDADPLGGDDWLDSVMASDFNLKSFVLREFSVADLGEAAVVKFERIQQATYKGKNESGKFFVVDLWKKNGDSWKLADRYVTKVSPLPENAPVQPKPTGKE